MECGFDTYKNALIKNLVISVVFFCAVEPIYSFFKPMVFDLIYNIYLIRLCIQSVTDDNRAAYVFYYFSGCHM